MPSKPATDSVERFRLRLPYEALLAEAAEQGRILHRDDIYGSGAPVDAVSEEILAFVLAHVGDSVLDVGCGIGPYVDRLCRLGKMCVGVDANADAVAAGQAMGRPLEVGSAYHLPFPDDSFDSVILVETLEHLEDPEQALAEASRVARSTIALTVPNIGVLPAMSKRMVVPWHLLEATHVNFFTPDIVRHVLGRYTDSCMVTTLGAFFEVDGETMHMHVAAAGHLRQEGRATTDRSRRFTLSRLGRRRRG